MPIKRWFVCFEDDVHFVVEAQNAHDAISLASGRWYDHWLTSDDEGLECLEEHNFDRAAARSAAQNGEAGGYGACVHTVRLIDNKEEEVPA